METNYWGLGIVVFLIVLSVVKYNCIDILKESIKDYLREIMPQKTIEKSDDILALEELTEEIAYLIIANKELFFKDD